MYVADHAPPHVHAVYAGEEAVIAIATGEILRGGLPDRALRMVRLARLRREIGRRCTAMS
jgi:hypothetical protein